MLDHAQHLLKTYFGYSAFREGQKRIITNILQKKHTLGIMPTGGGKSICYQLPALLFEGVTLVISPLISLMKDQVDTLHSLGIPSTYINSSISFHEVQDRIEKTRRGEFKLLYVAPERLESASFLALMQRLHIALIAIDEAHCMSQWGHDFRPSYRSIAASIKRIPTNPVVTAFTATATGEVIEDISALLSIEKENIFVSGFKRENLSFVVVRGANKTDYTEQYIRQNQNQPGIIYAATRKEVDHLHHVLRQKGYAVSKYHAGLSEEDRKRNQEKFLYDEIQIMIATNAFGMGIDKSNVRYVLHYNMPKNMESYYQEAGRAGRDGEPSECILLFSPRDIQIQKFLIEQSQSSSERKTHEYRKLQAMVDFCYTNRCLQQTIVEYFGEAGNTECGTCSNCQDDLEEIDITIDAQKIFSCIRRMNERFGATMVAKVLKGSNDKRVREFRLHSLPTYGLMKAYTEKEIVDLINVLIAEGYLALTEGQYPLVRLELKAVPVLKGEEQVFHKVRKVKESIAQNNDLFEKLRQLRKEISQREKVPPYVIFSDSTLRELSQFYPTDKASMLRIKGIAQAKYEKYGQAFLQMIKQHVSENEA